MSKKQTKLVNGKPKPLVDFNGYRVTKKRQSFVLNLLAGMDAEGAAVRAGYSAHSARITAWRIMRDPEIIAIVKRSCKSSGMLLPEPMFPDTYQEETIKAIRKKMEGIWDDGVIQIKLTTKYVIDSLIENAEFAKTVGHFSASNAALKLLGNHLGMFTDRSEILMKSEMKDALDKIITIIDGEVEDPRTRQRIIQRLIDAGKEQDRSVDVPA